MPKRVDFVNTFWGTVLKGVATAIGISCAVAVWSIFKSVQLIPVIAAKQSQTDSIVLLLTKKLTKLEQEKQDMETEARITEKILSRMSRNVAKNDSLSLKAQIEHDLRMERILKGN